MNSLDSKAVAAALAVLLSTAALRAAGQQDPTSLPAELSQRGGSVLTFHLVPIQYWDDPAGPVGHELANGRIYLYRDGSFEPEIVASAEEPITLTDGVWAWMAEAPGYVSTSTDRIFTLPPGKGPRGAS